MSDKATVKIESFLDQLRTKGAIPPQTQKDHLLRKQERYRTGSYIHYDIFSRVKNICGAVAANEIKTTSKTTSGIIGALKRTFRYLITNRNNKDVAFVLDAIKKDYHISDIVYDGSSLYINSSDIEKTKAALESLNDLLDFDTRKNEIIAEKNAITLSEKEKNTLPADVKEDEDEDEEEEENRDVKPATAAGVELKDVNLHEKKHVDPNEVIETPQQKAARKAAEAKQALTAGEAAARGRRKLKIKKTTVSDFTESKSELKKSLGVKFDKTVVEDINNLEKEVSNKKSKAPILKNDTNAHNNTAIKSTEQKSVSAIQERFKSTDSKVDHVFNRKRNFLLDGAETKVDRIFRKKKYFES